MKPPTRPRQPPPMADAGGRLQLRGAGRFVRDGQAAVDLEPKDALLLAYLAIEGPAPRGRLAGLLWPEVDDERARGNLRQRLLRLKRTAGVELVAGQTQAALAPGVAHDLDDADDLLVGIDPVLVGGLAEWLEGQREQRRRGRAQRLEAAATEAEAQGDLATALTQADALAALCPLSEHAHRRLMRLHYLRGDTAAALAAYERCRDVLRRELNAAPSRETEAMRSTLGTALATAAPAGASAAVPLSVLRPPRLIGRDAEWLALQAAWMERQPAFVLGEAGLGKTRLVTDLARALGPCAVVSARPGDERVVYALVTRLLRRLPPQSMACLPAAVHRELARLLPEFGEATPIGSETDRVRFFNAVGVAVEAAGERLAGLVVDDLHFADEASVELLRYLCTDSRLGWVFAARPGEIGAQARSFIDDLRSPVRQAVIALAPLTLAQLAEFVDALAIDGLDTSALVPALMQQTGGNPLFVLETLKAWIAQRGDTGTARLPVAAHLGDVVVRRIGRLSADAVRLARCAAVAGQDFSAALAAHVLGVRPLDLADAWAELEAAQVFRDGQFAHDLIYESALASVPPPIARQLHAELARFLQAHGGAPARIADHWLAAEQWQDAGAALVRAAAEAGRARRWREQAGLLGQAAGCFERTGDRAARFEALLARVDPLVYCDLGEETLACARAAEAAATDEAGRMRATLALLHVLTHRGDVDASITVGQRGLAMARARGDRDAEMRLALPLSANLCDAQRAGEALALLEPLRPWADRGASAAERCDYHVALGMALDQSSRLAEAIAALEQACAIARAESLTATLSEALSNLASAQAKTGRVRRAVELGQQAIALLSDGEPLAGRPIQSQLMLAHRLRDLGRYAEALPLFESALAGFEAEGSAYWRFAAAHRLALAHLQLGQYARASRLLAEEVSVHVPRTQALWAMVRAELARLSGPERWRDALAGIRQALDLLHGDTEDGAFRMACLFATAIVAPDEGEAMATALAAWANARERYGLAMAAHVRAARCALAQGAPTRALPHVEAALRLAPDYEADSHYRGELWLTAAQTMVALDHQAEAGRWVRDGCAWIASTAREHVPAEYRDSFLHRNPVNRELLALSTRRS